MSIKRRQPSKRARRASPREKAQPFEYKHEALAESKHEKAQPFEYKREALAESKHEKAQPFEYKREALAESKHEKAQPFEYKREALAESKHEKAQPFEPKAYIAFMSYRLYELQHQLRRVLSLNFPEPVWVRAELAAAKESNGHYFLELVEKDGPGEAILAQASAVVWERQYRRIRRARGAETMKLLRTGLELQLQVRVDFHERYGMQLFVEDIDPDFTYGQLAQQREATLAALRKAGLLDRNRSLPLPLVCQRLAVISGRTAAGYEDFREQLLRNEYGYAFELDFFPAAVQGERAPHEIRQQFKHIARRADRFDAVVVIRGGGGRLDLTAFDDPTLCQAAAELPLPLLTGVGHETDESILDLVAHTRCKTPTAAAEFLLQRSLQYEMTLLRRVRQLERLATQRVNTEQLRLAHLEQRLYGQTQALLYRQEKRLDRIETRLPLLLAGTIDRATRQLDRYEQLLESLDPEAVLARGYALVSQEGKIISAAKQIQQEEALHITLHQGEVVAWPERREDDL